jgi:hypothetical protein
MRTGLDHMAEGVWTVASKGIDARHEMNASRTWSLPKAVSTIRDPCWQRPDLTLEVVVLSDISDAWSGTGPFYPPRGGADFASNISATSLCDAPIILAEIAGLSAGRLVACIWSLRNLRPR